VKELIVRAHATNIQDPSQRACSALSSSGAVMVERLLESEVSDVAWGLKSGLFPLS